MVRKIIFVGIILSLWARISYAGQTFPFLGEILADRVNIRAGQSANFEKLCSLGKGEEVIVFERSYSWYKIKLPYQARCYVSADYVQQLDDHYGEILANRVNLRAGPGSNFTILGQLSKGRKIEVQENVGEGKWCKIKPVDECHGWVLDQYVSFKSGQIPSPMMAPATSGKAYAQSRLIKRQKASLQKTVDGQTKEEKSERLDDKNKKFFVTVGTIESMEEPFVDSVYHKLIIGEGTICYLMAEKVILDQFLDSIVKVEGQIKIDSSKSYHYPIIIVSKFHLLL